MVDHLAIGSEKAARPFGDVKNLLREQSISPPGQDKCIGSCYEAIVSLMDTDVNVEGFFEDIYYERPSLTPSHTVNLLFRSIQHIQLNLKKDLAYLDFQSSEDWMPTLVDIFDSEYVDVLKELLLTKDTVTTVFQRYAGPKAIISSYWNGDPVNIADFGCGSNVGLPGMEMNIPFQSISDGTPGQLMIAETGKPTNSEIGLAVDKQNPAESEVQLWSRACSYYPSELRSQNGNASLESGIKNGHSIVFLRADLLSFQAPHMIPKNEFDAVILSTILYQRTVEDRSRIIDEAREVIKPKGIVIIQDFARKSSHDAASLEFNGAWGGGEFGYRTFISRKYPDPDMLEVFRWSDGRCREVLPGEDFDAVMHVG